MNKIFLFLTVIFVCSCSGMKMVKEPPVQEKSKPGISLKGPVFGPIQVKNVGFWCDAKHGLLTFSAFGEAKANAQSKCHGLFKNGACEVVSCKPA